MSAINRKTHRLKISLVLKRHLAKILVIGALSFLVSAPILYFNAKESYSAVVELRIDPVSTSVIPGMDSSIGQFYNEYVATQKFKILKRENVQKALNAVGSNVVNRLLGGNPVNDASINGILKAITIVPSRESLILTVGITGDDPYGLAEFLNSLIGIYLEDLRNEKGSKETSRINFSDQQKADLELKIESINLQLKQISEEVATGNFSSDDIPFKIEVKIQEEAAVRAENDRVLKEKRYNDFLKNMYKSSSAGLDSQVESRLASDQFLTEQKKLLLSRMDSLSTQLNSLSAQNAGRKEIEDSIAKVQTQISDLETKAREKYKKLIDSENSGSLEKQKNTLYSEYIISKEFEDAVKRSYESVKAKYAFISKRVLVGRGLQQDLIDLKAQLGRVNETRTVLVGDQASSGLVTVENYAKSPVLPDKSSTAKNLILAFVGSFLWITAAVFLFEFLDQRVKSAAELKAFTGIKPSWPLSHHSGSILEVSISDRDSGVFKAIQSLATRINQERQNFQVKVVTFCGIGNRTGASEILLNCAHAMTDNCEKILVVDFNIARPAIAAKVGIPLKVQTTAKNLEQAALETVVHVDQARDVEVLTVRNMDKLENKIIDRILELAKDRYDMIFIDAAPLLTSSSTENLFMKSDLAVFVVRGNSTKYSDIQHTLELASKFSMSAAALVLNWWRPDPKVERTLQEADQDS